MVFTCVVLYRVRVNMYFRCMVWQAQILDFIHCALQHPSDLCEVIRHDNTSYQCLQWYDCLSFTVSSCYTTVCCVDHLGSCWNATLVTFSRVLDFYFRITYMRSLVLKTVTCGHLQCYSAYHLRCHVSNYCRSTHHLQHWPFQTLA